MEILKDYTPAEYVPVLPDGEAQEVLNNEAFEQEEAQKFIAENFTAFSEASKCLREMDVVEIGNLRARCNNLIENDLPDLEQAFIEAEFKAKQATDAAKSAKEAYNVCVQQMKDLGKQVRQGTIEHEFGAHELWKVPIGKKYRYYALIEGFLTLVKVADIPSWEERDLLNSMNNNLEKHEALRDGAFEKAAM